MPTFGSLFSGIGGMDLGLERAGWECRWQVEIDDYCRRVLEKHWPDVPRFGDVRDVTALPYVDLIAGGFPCQDISTAGKGAGIEGPRSGLWSEFNRIIRLVRPRLVLVENVPALLGRGLGRVLGDLAESGYDAEWDCIPAAAVGAPHLRDRLFIVAYATGADAGSWPRQQQGAEPLDGEQALVLPDASGCGRRDTPAVADADAFGRDGRKDNEGQEASRRDGTTGGSPADTFGSGLEERPQPLKGTAAWRDTADQSSRASRAVFREPPDSCGTEWAVEPDVGRVAYGVPARVDRLKGLGNAVVPQVAEWIGRRIINAEKGSHGTGPS